MSLHNGLELIYEPGDIFVIPPKLAAKPRFLTNVKVIVVKVPSLGNKDKVVCKSCS